METITIEAMRNFFKLDKAHGINKNNLTATWKKNRKTYTVVYTISDDMVQRSVTVGVRKQRTHVLVAAR